MDEMRVETRFISTSLAVIYGIRRLSTDVTITCLSLSNSDIDEAREETRLDFIFFIKNFSTDTIHQQVSS